MWIILFVSIRKLIEGAQIQNFMSRSGSDRYRISTTWPSHKYLTLHKLRRGRKRQVEIRPRRGMLLLTAPINQSGQVVALWCIWGHEYLQKPPTLSWQLHRSWRKVKFLSFPWGWGAPFCCYWDASLARGSPHQEHHSRVGLTQELTSPHGIVLCRDCAAPVSPPAGKPLSQKVVLCAGGLALASASVRTRAAANCTVQTHHWSWLGTSGVGSNFRLRI